MDDNSRELSSLESSFPSGSSALTQNEQANEKVQLLWSSYRKPTPSPDSDRESDASDVSSDGSVRWEKNFIGKLVNVKKHSCQQERTAPTSEDLEACTVKQELVLSCESKPDSKCDSQQLQKTEELRPDLSQDVKEIPVKHELLPSCKLELDEKGNSCQLKASKKLIPNLKQDVTETLVEEKLSLPCDVKQDTTQSSCQLEESDELRPVLNQDLMGSLTNSQVSSTCDSGSMVECCVSCLHECEDTRQKVHSENHQFQEVSERVISGVIEQQPECSTNCHVSSSCDSDQLQGSKQLRSNIGKGGHTCCELNLGYVSRWMKEPPGSPRHCEVSSSSYDSESDDEHTGSHEQERERRNWSSVQQAESKSDLIVAGTSEESKKMIESPRNCLVSSSCESDSDTSGYSKLCLRVSEDSVEDDTDHSSGKEKRNKSSETSANRKDGDEAHINVRHKQSNSVKSLMYDVCDEVPTRTPRLSLHIGKKRSSSHSGQLASYSVLDSNRRSHRRQQWTRDFPYGDRPARLRSQSPTDRVGRWRRSQSPVEYCRRLRSRSVLSIRATGVTLRKRRSKSCDTYSKHIQSHESREPSNKHLPFKGMESVSKAPSRNGVKRQSRSSRRRWSKSASLPGRHKTSSSNREKSILQVTTSNAESLPVRTAVRCALCNNTQKFQSHVNQTYLSKTRNVSEEQLTSRTQRSLSRSRSKSNRALQESVAENIQTKVRHSMPEVHAQLNEKEEPLQGRKVQMKRQSVSLNTSKRNYRTSKKKDSPKEHITTMRSDSGFQDTPRIFTQLNKCHELSQEQPVIGSKLSMPVRRCRSTADSSRNRQLSSEQSSFKNICSITNGSSTSFQQSDPTNAFRGNTRSYRHQILSEDWSTSTNRHSPPVNASRRQSHFNKFREKPDQSTFSKAHPLLMKSTERVHLSKGKKLTDDHVIDSSCLKSVRTAKSHAKSKNNQELAEDTLHLRNFKGFPEEEVSLKSKFCLRTIMSESCDYPISTETLHQVRSANKTRHSGSVLTRGTLSSLNKDELASELLGSPDNRDLHHRLSRKRKYSNEVYKSHDKSLTSRSLFSLFSGSYGKQTQSYIAEGRPVKKNPSHNRCSFVKTTSVACENQEHYFKRSVLGKFKKSSEAVQSMLQSKQVEVSRNKSHLHQKLTCNSHLRLRYSSAVNEPAATNETPCPSSKEKKYTKISARNSSLFKDTSAVYDATPNATMVKCSLHGRNCYKEDDVLLGPSKNLIKPCSVVLKNLVFSSVYEKYLNKYEKFVFPPFPHVASVTKERHFCLPRDYTNTVGRKGK